MSETRIASRATEWIDCPICGEPDMPWTPERDEPGRGYITCLNLPCPSNRRTPPARELPPVEQVTQADRDAAADAAWASHWYGLEKCESIRNGKHDNSFSVQAFARHRRLSALPAQAINADLREALREAIRATEYKYFGDYEMSDDQRKAVDTLVDFARTALSQAEASNNG